MIGSKKTQVFGYSGSLSAWIKVAFDEKHQTENVVSDFAREV
jgi:hypothetical protein